MVSDEIGISVKDDSFNHRMVGKTPSPGRFSWLGWFSCKIDGQDDRARTDIARTPSSGDVLLRLPAP
jgi:hypothetical protein